MNQKETNQQYQGIESTIEWFKKAIPNPTPENLCVQVGCHIEEYGEMMYELAKGSLYIETTQRWADKFKTKEPSALKSVELISESKKRQTDFLDAMLDQIVTNIGILHMMGYDIQGALAEVNRSNFSKFDENGNPIFNENGKISKGANYTPPNLKEFLPKSESE